MATIWVAEFEDVYSYAQVVRQPPLASYTLTVGNSSVTTQAFGASTKVVRVNTDTVCLLTFSTAPVATTTTGERLPANTTEYWAVPANTVTTLRIAVIGSV